MAETRANAVAVVVTWYQATRYATAIAPDPHRTPSDEGVIRTIREAKARGLKVLLRPNVDGVRQEWRGRFAPSNEAEWFASWRRMVNHYAVMAQSLGVDVLQVGSEFESLSGNADAWRRVVAEARTRFHGTIVYGANWGEFESIGWWDAVDVIGIDAYFPLSDAETPSEAEIVRASHDRWMRRIEAVQARAGKPLLFSEIGYASRTRALVDPWYAAGTPYSAGDQERALGALFSAFADKPWFRGVYVWQWNADPDFGGSGDRDHTPQNKPAEALFAQRWWASCAPVSARSPSAQPGGAPVGGQPVAPSPAPAIPPASQGDQKGRTSTELTSVRVAARRRIRVAGKVRGVRAGVVELPSDAPDPSGALRDGSPVHCARTAASSP